MPRCRTNPFVWCYRKGNKHTGTAEYTYDANGNLTKDLNKGILSITYNYLNLPVSITKSGGTRVEYSYDAAGTKREQRYYLNGTLTKTTSFYANFVYENSSSPSWINYDEGRLVLNTDGSLAANEGYIKDHLGNVRVVFYWYNYALKTQQVNSYYPFGMNIKGLTANGSATYKQNKYLYNGKMMQDEMGLNWLDYGARFYDAVLGRWHTPDPLVEKYRRWSTYNYCVDNPLRFIDPDGMGVGGPPYSQTFTSKQNAATGEVIRNIVNDPKTGRIVESTGKIVFGGAQFLLGVSFATVTLPTGVGEFFGGMIALHGAYKAGEGLHQVANVLGGVNSQEDPKYSTPEGAITKNEKIDHAVDLIAGLGKGPVNAFVDATNKVSTGISVFTETKDIVKEVPKVVPQKVEKSNEIEPIEVHNTPTRSFIKGY